MSKKIFIFINKYRVALLCFGVILTSSFGMFFSFLYGTSNPNIMLHANLMAIDAKTKEQDIGFIHGYLKLDNSIGKREQYNYNLSLQYKTTARHLYYNSYLASTNNNGITNYKSTLHSYSTKTELCDLGDLNVAMVRNYYDSEYMESIGLPLFLTEKGNRIGSNKSGVNYGSYISASQAYQIAVSIGLIEDGEKDTKKIKDAFALVVDPQNDYYMYLNSPSYGATFCIRNIYIDEAFDFLLTESQREVSSREYGNYYKSFTYWKRNTIFTYSENMFSLGSTFYFDIRGSVNNINMFISQILGKHYSMDGSTIHFETQTEHLDDYSKNVDEACRRSGKGNIVYLLLAILFFESLLVVYIYLISEKFKKKWLDMLMFFLPLLPFVGLWLILCCLLFDSGLLCTIYYNFNYLGNAIVLIFLTIIILCGIIWRRSDDKNKKII